ncbi:PP2C family protein-serine/threonine phosphatase [Nonomuraea sp. NPDC003560]|uniref:PP2C family protein-serine/threonine phosphatase n=1 Tax=Nonomuraea sp. NPDC003560 TaxID=3364341 RepID=UPI00367C4DC4
MVNLTWNAASRTCPGSARRHIVDDICTGPYLFAVADGRRERVAGDVASHLVTETLRKYDREIDPSDLTTVVEHALRSANESLQRRIEAQPELAGMGADLVAMAWSGTTAVFTDAGDTQAYFTRRTAGGAAELIWTTASRAHGTTEAPGAPSSPERIPNFLDGRPHKRVPDLVTFRLHAGDRILLCTGGLGAAVPHPLLMDVLSGPGGSADVADRLEALVVEHGGPDNITMVVVEFVDFEEHREEYTFID